MCRIPYGYHTVNCRGIISSLLVFLFLFTRISSEVRFSPFPRKKNDLVGFLPVNYLLCYTVYIHNVYKHMSNIYIIHIYFRPSRKFTCFLFFSFSPSHSLSSSILIYRLYFSLTFSRECNKYLRII